MKKHKKLSAKLFLALISGISVVIILALFIEFRLSKRYIDYQTQSFTANNIRYQIHAIKEELETFKRLSNNVSVLISSVNMDSMQIEQLHRLIFNLSEEIHGIGISISNNEIPFTDYHSYLFREDDSISMLPVLPFNTDEFSDLNQAQGPHLVSSTLGDTLFVFYAKIPSQSANNSVLLTVDFSPKFIDLSLEKVAGVYGSNYLIIDHSERILFNNFTNLSENKDLYQFYTDGFKSYYSYSTNLRNLSNELFIPSNEYNKSESVYIVPLVQSGWICLFFIPGDKLNRTLVLHFLLVSILSIFAILLASLVISYFARKITGPLSIITKAVKSLENGNLYSNMPEIDTDDELEDIAKSFQRVQAKMQRFASGFKNSLEQKRALVHDLRLANRIQESMLPDQFQGLTDFKEINLFTRLVPAKGVAGDFFEIAFLDGNQFFFIVGDVSGKGMPAALYMVKVLTLLRTEKIRSMPLHSMFTEISNSLMSVNNDGIFVTALGGILNYQTGELVLCDAGHNPPFISSNGEAFTHFQVNKNVPLGVVADHVYAETNMNLNRNDALFLYTDGLPEALDTNGIMFNEERIKSALEGNQNKKLEVIFNNLKNSLLNFVGKAKLADDITVFLLRYMK